MVKAETAGSSVLFEVRRNIDVGSRTLKRGSRITMAELERLAPGKSGPLRRTGIVRPVGETVKEKLHSERDARADRLHRASRADNASLSQFRKPLERGSDE